MDIELSYNTAEYNGKEYLKGCSMPYNHNNVTDKYVEETVLMNGYFSLYNNKKIYLDSIFL